MANASWDAGTIPAYTARLTVIMPCTPCALAAIIDAIIDSRPTANVINAVSLKSPLEIHCGDISTAKDMPITQGNIFLKYIAACR